MAPPHQQKLTQSRRLQIEGLLEQVQNLHPLLHSLEQFEMKVKHIREHHLYE